jgi:hypothetical protein
MSQNRSEWVGAQLSSVESGLLRVLRWRRQSGDEYNLGAQFVDNY